MNVSTLHRFVLIFALAALFLSSTAHAKDMRGKMGIGAISALSGAEGLSLRYWASRDFGVEILTGLSVLDREEGKTRVAFAGGIQGLYVLREIGRANLNVGLRVTLGYLNEVNAEITPGGSNENAQAEQSEESAILHVATEIPLTLEYHFADAFSIQMSTGLLISFIPERGAVLEGGPLLWGGSPESGVAFAIGSGGLFGNAGFTYYF